MPSTINLKALKYCLFDYHSANEFLHFRQLLGCMVVGSQTSRLLRANGHSDIADKQSFWITPLYWPGVPAKNHHDLIITCPDHACNSIKTGTLVETPTSVQYFFEYDLPSPLGCAPEFDRLTVEGDFFSMGDNNEHEWRAIAKYAPNTEEIRLASSSAAEGLQALADALESSDVPLFPNLKRIIYFQPKVFKPAMYKAVTKFLSDRKARGLVLEDIGLCCLGWPAGRSDAKLRALRRAARPATLWWHASHQSSKHYLECTPTWDGPWPTPRPGYSNDKDDFESRILDKKPATNWDNLWGLKGRTDCATSD
jgi:hypothetical protein